MHTEGCAVLARVVHCQKLGGEQMPEKHRSVDRGRLRVWRLSRKMSLEQEPVKNQVKVSLQRGPWGTGQGIPGQPTEGK